LRESLLAAYAEPERAYHTTQHLRECLALLRCVEDLAKAPAELALALWFHDAVYHPRAQHNERRSADWLIAETRNAGLDEMRIAGLEALVMATCHDSMPTPEAGDAALLVDIDLAILGAAPERFDEYEQQVRREYAHVPDEVFRSARAEILRGFLHRPRLFQTERLHRQIEAAARSNLERSLDQLER
jgi:predicted metal-dependent HD superfamily phosphohydrolase